MRYSDNNATAIPAATTRTNGVATKITNVALWYGIIALLITLLVCEGGFVVACAWTRLSL